MRKTILSYSLCTAALIAATPALAAPWSRGFVVDFYEPAFYYGGPPLTTEAPGTDCPNGTVSAEAVAAQGANIVSTLVSGSLQRTDAPPRTFAPGIDVYMNPHTAPDPGLQEVTGKIAVGFNLDGKADTGGFVGVDGVQGVDNQLYRILGCHMSYRGIPYHAHLSMRANDKMLEGLYTIAVLITGNGADPMNDDNVVVEIGYSPDAVVKDANGKAAQDYSYRLAVNSAQYTRLKGSVKNGVVSTDQVPDLRMPQFAWYETNRGGTNFKNGKLQLVLNKDGTMSGIVGGYLDWRHFYAMDSFNRPSGGSNRESYYHQNQVGIYYGLKRAADGVPDPKTGLNTAISAAYRFTAQPAFVVDPPRQIAIEQPMFDERVPADRLLFLEASNSGQVMYRPTVNARLAGGLAGAPDARAVVAATPPATPAAP
jgi:hypothetical protein